METQHNQAGTKIDNGIQMFNTVQSRLDQINVNETLDNILVKISKEDVVLEDNEYEVLGAISYLVGLDFYSMNEWNPKIMTNVILRLSINKINDVLFSKFVSIMKKVTKLEIFSFARLSLMDKIKSRLMVKNEIDLVIKIRNVIQNSIVPVEISNDLHERFFEKDFLIYHDLLVFNSFAYNDSIFGGKASKLFVELSNNENYVSSLALASNYFEVQKFALFYEESIVNFYSKNINGYNTFFDTELFESFLQVLLTEDEINVPENQQTLMNALDSAWKKLGKNEQKAIETETPIHENPVVTPLTDGVETLTEAVENPLENPTEVIEKILSDFNQIRLDNKLDGFDYQNDPKQLLLSLESLIEVEELIGSFYMFLSKYNEFKRTPDVLVKNINVTKLFNYSEEVLVETFQSEIKDLQEKYKKIVADYVIDIPENDLAQILIKLNSLLETVFTGTSEDKGFILSQLNENTIFTFKHLHQIITIIENQYIDGNEIDKYIEFKTFMENEHKDILNLFDESQKLESYEMLIKVFHTFLSTII